MLQVKVKGFYNMIMLAHDFYNHGMSMIINLVLVSL